MSENGAGQSMDARDVIWRNDARPGLQHNRKIRSSRTGRLKEAVLQ